MAERTEERTRESTVETDLDESMSTDLGDGGATDETRATTGEATATDGGQVFSARALLFAFAAVGGGTVLGGLVPLIPFTGVLGIALGGFLYGLLASQRRYLEVALAGGTAAGVSVTLSWLPRLLLFEGISGVELFALAGGVGLVLAVVGHYFGRDLRAGLTKELP